MENFALCGTCHTSLGYTVSSMYVWLHTAFLSPYKLRPTKLKAVSQRDVLIQVLSYESFLFDSLSIGNRSLESQKYTEL